VEPDGESSTRAVLYLWQPPGSPVMVAAELSGDRDEEAMLYLFSLAGMQQLRKAVRNVGRLIERTGDHDSWYS